MSPALRPYQIEFADFLVNSNALQFGEFTLKSGRVAPYFINTGKLDDGGKITQLGEFYAAHLMSELKGEVDIIFGPAYKGIPLAVGTAAALYRNFALNIGFTFDRKEEKDHGDKGKLVGREIRRGSRVIIVEDVITAGTTLRKVVPFIRDTLGADLRGVILAVDRCEKGTGNSSAIKEVRESLGVNIYPIISVYQLASYLSSTNSSGLILNEDLQRKIKMYLEQYGAV